MGLCRTLGVPATLENPWTSRIWNLSLAEQFCKLPRVRLEYTDFCQYGMPWRKRTGFLGVNLECEWRQCKGRVCSRTGLPHLELKGRPEGELLTQQAEAYPYELCRALVGAVARALLQRSADKVARFFAPEC